MWVGAEGILRKHGSRDGVLGLPFPSLLLCRHWTSIQPRKGKTSEESWERRGCQEERNWCSEQAGEPSSLRVEQGLVGTAGGVGGKGRD